jgi:2-dehydropantoate 2-reductase
MKICVYGAGAIGGLLGAKLASGGAEVALIARGDHLAAIREGGLTLVGEGREEVHRLKALEDPAEAGPQDFVILAVKTHSTAAVARRIDPLIGPETAIVSAQNGIPWWYFHGIAGPLEGYRLKSVDPDGRLNAAMPPERCIGCVIYPAGELLRPGVIKHGFGNRFLLGEPDGRRTARVAALSEAMARGGLEAPVRESIRDDIWMKLWGNLSFNPISVLTGARLASMALDPGTRAVARTMMLEAQRVAEALGIRFPIDVDARIGMAEAVGEHKTSMLQDLERGRPLEIDAMVAVISEMAGLLGLETPMTDAVVALVRQRAAVAGCR